MTKTTPKTMRERFDKVFKPQGLASDENMDIIRFIESELALRDAHHKALRAKELGEIRERIAVNAHYYDGIDADGEEALIKRVDLDIINVLLR